MRDFQRPGRSPAHGQGGMAATSHPAATLTALDILRSGGNAVDAAIAAAAVLGVVEPQSTGVGGDVFALYAPAGRMPPIALNGSGRAAAAATIGWFQERGIKAIDYQSPHAVSVPGAVAAWVKLHSDHGSKELGELLRPAIDYADKGYVVHSRIATDWARNVEKLSVCPHARRIFLPGGRAPAVGSVHRQPELAATLRRIAKDGRAGFYSGETAEDIVFYLKGLGGLLTREDFARYDASYVTPISTNYRGFDVYECPPNGQGMLALIMLNILEGFDLAPLDPNGAERLHLEAEATRLAYRDRAAFLADPAHVEVPVKRLVSKEYGRALQGYISRERALGSLPSAGLPDHKDTVYLCVVDEKRNAISFINSTFHNFGSGLCAPKSGVMLQNRAASFVVDRPDHPNAIAPGKRPMHTIIPGMVGEGGRALMPFGVMGGHYQATGHVHFLTNLIDYGMDVQEALDSPRAFHFDNVYELESGVSEETAAGLAKLGHQIKRCDLPHGGGQAIRINWESGVLTGGSDPRKDGIALGY
jgi:gamma-glutamyltranspeptidase/glutathione hydrolase